MSTSASAWTCTPHQISDITMSDSEINGYELAENHDSASLFSKRITPKLCYVNENQTVSSNKG